MQNLWIDVMAGSIGAMLWAGLTLFARREWIQTKHWVPALALFWLLALGGGLFIWRLIFWAHERADALGVVVSL